MKDLPSLISITSDNSRLPHHEQVRVLIEKGARFVQLRSKLLGHNELVDQVKLSSQYVLQSDIILIVNDFTKVAQSISVSGVHLGANDCNVELARKQLGDNAIIGSTVHNLEDAIKVKQLGVCNYVGLGPYRKSKTKLDLEPILSQGMIQDILEVLSDTPVFLIGGIELDDCNLVSRYGLAGLAVCSALSREGEYGNYVNDFIKQLSLEKCAVV